MWILDGLPLHPLIVHAPVVLIPLVAAGIVLLLLVPGWRRPLGPILASMAAAAAVTAIAAVSSGDALGETLRRGGELDAHRAFGERTRFLAVLLALGTVALVLYERRPNRVEARVVGGIAAVAALAVASATTVAMTGHSGAELAWRDALPAVEVAPGANNIVAAAAPPPSASQPPGEPGIDVALGEWALVASTLEAPPGPTTFRFRNAGTVTHALRIRTPGSGRDRLEWRSQEVAPGETGTLVADLGAGSFEMTCPIEDALGEHDALGMEAVLAVSPTAPPPTTPPVAAAAPATAGAVAISGFAFAPAEITVPVGTDVVWTNRDPAPHTATGDGWDTGQLAGGAAGTIRFPRAGRFEYFCAIHPGMVGTVVVE